jgi:hypothetical protein
MLQKIKGVTGTPISVFHACEEKAKGRNSRFSVGGTLLSGATVQIRQHHLSVLS